MTAQTPKASQRDLDTLRESHEEIARLQGIAMRNLKIAMVLATVAALLNLVLLVVRVV